MFALFDKKRSKITNVLSKTQGVEKEEVVDASFNSKNTFCLKALTLQHKKELLDLMWHSKYGTCFYSTFTKLIFVIIIKLNLRSSNQA